MKIEDLGVSEKCLAELQRVGFTEVGEIVEFFEIHTKDDMLLLRWIPICFDDFVQRLKVFGLWSEKIERNWPENADD